MPERLRFVFRPLETLLLVIVMLLGGLGFALVTAALHLRQEANPIPALSSALLPPAVLVVALLLLHLLLQWRGVEVEQVMLPIVGLLVAVGLTMIWRLRPPEAVWQQLWRGFIPGVSLMAVLMIYPRLVERIRRDWVVGISLAGLGLLIATAFFGVVDESGARLALKLGPLPAVQTSELIKLALIIFLAWYIEKEGEAVEGRARSLRWLRIPAVRYFIPGLLYVFLATLALVMMSDFGAVLILGALFVGMLYAGFETRIFLTVAAVGLGLSLLVGLILAYTWETPAVIQQRLAAFINPWSNAPLLIDGQPTGVTIAEGPGYQIQQAIYALIAGGLTGTGLGFGLPNNIPLAHSDFIFAAILEELGAVVGLALLAFYLILLLRILRVAVLLPPGQQFERLLLVGISIHFFIQVLVMVGGTLNLLPLTGVTLPFLSQGGMALLVNLTEVGLVLAIIQRLEAPAS
jgi:cell division protein FtsW (lipid II flippase)